MVGGLDFRLKLPVQVGEVHIRLHELSLSVVDSVGEPAEIFLIKLLMNKSLPLKHLLLLSLLLLHGLVLLHHGLLVLYSGSLVIELLLKLLLVLILPNASCNQEILHLGLSEHVPYPGVDLHRLSWR